MDSIIFFFKSDRINRIIRIFFVFINFHLPVIASRSGEAGGEEIDETQSTFGGKKDFRLTIVSLFNFGTKKLWLPYAYYNLPRRRRLGVLYFIQKQRIKNPINPVDPVKE